MCARIKENRGQNVWIYSVWLLNEIAGGKLSPKLYFISDEAWFHLSGHVNSQNTTYLFAEKPHNLHDKPLHDQKMGVWCAVSGNRIVGPIFFDTTVNRGVSWNFRAILCQINRSWAREMLLATEWWLNDPNWRGLLRGTNCQQGFVAPTFFGFVNVWCLSAGYLKGKVYE